jgi:hypothetical protein
MSRLSLFETGTGVLKNSMSRSDKGMPARGTGVRKLL